MSMNGGGTMEEQKHSIGACDQPKYSIGVQMAQINIRIWSNAPIYVSQDNVVLAEVDSVQTVGQNLATSWISSGFYQFSNRLSTI